MRYFKVLLIDILIWSESNPACQISSDQTSGCQAVMLEPDRGYGRLIGGDIRSSTQMRLSSVCITETGGSECRVNSDVFLFCYLSQSAGWWNRSPMAVFLPCRAAALPAVVDPREGASPLVPAAQVRVFRPDCCLSPIMLINVSDEDSCSCKL